MGDWNQFLRIEGVFNVSLLASSFLSVETTLIFVFFHFPALFSWEYAEGSDGIAGKLQLNDVVLLVQVCPSMAAQHLAALLWLDRTSDEFRGFLFKSVPRFLRFFGKSTMSLPTSHFSVSTSFPHKIFLPILNFTWGAGSVWISGILQRRCKSRSLSRSKPFSSSDLALSNRKKHSP